MSLTVRMAEPLGMLGPAMKQQLEDSQQVDMALGDAMGRFFYLGTVIVFMWVVCAFVMLKIVPVFQKMFEEFGLRLPAMTRFVIEVSRWFVRVGWIPILPLAALIVPAFVIVTVLYYAGWLPRGFALWWGFSKHYDGAIVMRRPALAIRRGMPIPERLRGAQSYPLSIVGRSTAHCRRQGCRRRRLVRKPAQDGLDHRRRCSRIERRPTSRKPRLGTRRNGGQCFTAAGASRAGSAANSVSLALLTIGVFVFLFVCGLFLPLISLIQGLA